MKFSAMTMSVIVLSCGATLLLSGCGANEQQHGAQAAWAKDFDSVAQQFQLIRQAHAQESNSLTPQAQTTFQNMQSLWQQMNQVESSMMQNAGSTSGRGMMGGHRTGSGMMARGRMGAGMMGGPAMMRFNEMNQQMLSYCMGMQQMMQQAGRSNMAAMYGRMAGGMKSVLSGLPAGSETVPAAPQTQQHGEAAVTDGAAVYAANCAGCHGADGTGMSGVFPPLSGSSVAGSDQQVAAKIVLHGLQGQLTVSGGQYNGLMPAFGNTLTDGQIAAALSYVHTLPGNKGGTVNADSVSRVRRTTASHVQPWTPQELGLD